MLTVQPRRDNLIECTNAGNDIAISTAWQRIDPARDLIDNFICAAEGQHILRCLGAALILQWNKLPRELQRELFDAAGSIGELLDTEEFRGKIARFLHKHKNDEEASRWSEQQTPGMI